MPDAPHIWLGYRPIRIGWLVTGGSLDQLRKAAIWSTALWGGRFNPIIPLHDPELSRNLVRTFAVDLLVPVEPDAATARFKEDFGHVITSPLWGERVFSDDRCNFVDIRHAVRRAGEQIRSRANVSPPRFLRLTWDDKDPFATLLHLLVGRYPDPDEVQIKYATGIDAFLKTEEIKVANGAEVPSEVYDSVTPLDLTRFEIVLDREHSFGWMSPGLVLGSADDFDDLVLLWNLRAAGAKIVFYDHSRGSRLQPYLKKFLDFLRASPVRGRSQVSLWSRTGQFESDLDLTDLERGHCRPSNEVWNGLNVRPRQHTSHCGIAM